MLNIFVFPRNNQKKTKSNEKEKIKLTRFWLTFRRKKALHDAHERTLKLNPIASSPQITQMVPIDFFPTLIGFDWLWSDESSARL